jgi:DNA-binding MurR/RpiR family transcriptional regulator
MDSMFSRHSSVPLSVVGRKLRALTPKLSRSEARVANYVLTNLGDIAFETGASLAGKVRVSEITVSRFLRKAGYKGIVGLKRELRTDGAATAAAIGRRKHPIGRSPYTSVRELELQAVAKAFDLFHTDEWRKLVRTVVQARDIYVTGFQSVRGTAEDFCRRLLLARSNVRYLSAHDGMLGEWLEFHGDVRPKAQTLILIDVVPYAREGRTVAQIAKEMGFRVIVVSDEYCDWAHGIADHAVNARSRSGLFLESTVALVLILNVLVDAVARAGATGGRRRFESWQLMTRRLEIF